jgi:hypothetical protein
MEKSQKIQRIIRVLLKIIGKIFSGLFSATFSKFCNFTASNFSRPWTFFRASFELFDPKFGHLATVLKTLFWRD